LKNPGLLPERSKLTSHILDRRESEENEAVEREARHRQSACTSEETFHSLRHTYVSFMANKGVSKEIRKKLACHTTDAHDRYTHFELGAIRGALKDFPSVFAQDSGKPDSNSRGVSAE
jgi:hypothetical protein